MAQEFTQPPNASPPNSRRTPRVQVQVDATVLIVFPEETFSSFPVHGRTLDMSATGIRVVTTSIDDRLYRRLIQAVRYAKVALKLPETNEQVTLHGCIVWVNFDNRQSPALCQIGITFEKLSPVQALALERSLFACAAQPPPSPPPAR